MSERYFLTFLWYSSNIYHLFCLSCQTPITLLEQQHQGTTRTATMDWKTSDISPRLSDIQHTFAFGQKIYTLILRLRIGISRHKLLTSFKYKNLRIWNSPSTFAILVTKILFNQTWEVQWISHSLIKIYCKYLSEDFRWTTFIPFHTGYK